MSLDEVCAELRKHGVNTNADEIRKTYPEEEQLARAERNLWKMLRNIEEERNRMSGSV